MSERCTDDSCICRKLPDKERMDSLVENAMDLASDLHHAPGTAGWQNKPHRYIYDATAIIKSQALVIAQLKSKLAQQPTNSQITTYDVDDIVDVVVPGIPVWCRGEVIATDVEGHRVTVRLYHNDQEVIICMKSAGYKIKRAK